MPLPHRAIDFFFCHDKPQAAGAARRGGRAAAPEGLRLLTPAPRQGSTVCIPMLTSACSSAPELDRQATPDSRHGAPRLGYRERLGTRRAVKRSTARRSTAGSTAIREHAVTAVGIRTNETLQHTFRTGRRAAATRATHGRAGEAPPTVCQQPARVVRDESWDESWAPYYNLYAGTPRDSSGTNGASGCQPRNQDTQVHASSYFA